MNKSPSLPPVLRSKLAGFRRRVWILKTIEGLLAALFGLAVSYLLVLGLDRFFETSAWLRTLVLVAGAAVPGIGLPLKWHHWVWRQRRLEDAAKLLRGRFPRLSDQLLGIVELARQDSVAGRSERLVEAAMGQAEEAVKDLDFSDAVPRPSHRRWAWAALLAGALVATGLLTMNEAARNAFVRWLTPWKDTERFTYARVEALPNPLVVPLAEPVTLPVRLSESSRWKPETATARLAKQERVSAEREDASYALNLPPQKNDTKLSLKVGDVRETLRIEPRSRPELTGLKVRLKLPAYLEYQTEPVTEVRGGAASIVRGAQATVEATASRELSEATIDGDPVTVLGDRMVSASQVVTEPREMTLEWKDVLGLTPQSPLTLKVLPVEDEAPRIVARRDSLEQVVLDSELVLFDVSATDDFGIRHVGLQWSGLGTSDPDLSRAEGSKVVAAGAPEKKSVEARATFSANQLGIEPQTIEVRAWAEDYLPGREASRSAVFILHVLDPEAHAMWVTQQMARWLEAAKETYEREQRLHATNKELRNLEPDELDRPENRGRIATQASAESNNAERLASLTASGRKLVEHATKNEEFDAPRLESWALMLRMLEDIAQNRMPSVADLLKQAADAKPGPGHEVANGGAKNSPSPDGSPSTPGEGQGSGKGGESQTAQNQPADGQSKAGSPGDSISAPSLNAGPSSPKGGGPQEGEAPESTPKKSDPSLALKESTMFKPKPGEPQPPGKAGAASLTLPQNSLAMPPMKFTQPAPPAGSAADSLDQGIDEQRDLLAEFAKITDQLNEILISLESSTFVKRFKAASRKQTELATSLGERSLEGFGIARANPNNSLRNLTTRAEEAGEADAEVAPAAESDPEPGSVPDPPAEPAAEAVADREDEEVPFVTSYAPLASRKAKSQSETVRIILADLQAYFQRRADLHVKKVLDEMKETRVVPELARVGERAADNYSGNAIHAAELWADTMDRWAEEMVSIGKAFC